MADPGQQLLALINACVAKGENRLFAEREVFRLHPDLVRQWHHGEGQEPPEVEIDGVDPGLALHQLIEVRVRGGMPRDRARALSFAEYPAVFEAYHRGELIPNSAGKVGAPQVLCFRAALDGDVAGDELLRVPIFRCGTWNNRRYVEADLDAMVEAASAGHFQIPVKVGHDMRPDVPAVGRISRLWRADDVLFANFADVDPAVMEAIRRGRLLSLSCEVALGMERSGKKYRAALLAVSLLGGHAPGVDLPPLREAIAA